MAEDYKQLYGDELPAAQTELYEVVGPVTEVLVKHIRAVSTDAGDKWLKMWHTSGGAPSDADLILPQTDITAGGWGEFEGTILMEVGDKLYAEAETVDTITLSVYGLELS